jgi:uncharacterized protein YyaL (SSP411 family)
VQNGVSVEFLKKQLAACRAELHAAREKKPRPSLDDKVEKFVFVATLCCV